MLVFFLLDAWRIPNVRFLSLHLHTDLSFFFFSFHFTVHNANSYLSVMIRKQNKPGIPEASLGKMLIQGDML